MSISRGPKIIKDNLVLYLDAADKNSYVSGSSTWYDLSGNNNTGSLTNGPTFNSANQGNIVFDGSDDYVDCGNSTSVQITKGTLSAWIKTSNAGSSYRGIITKQNNYGIFTFNNLFIAYDWGNSSTRSTGINIADGTWKNVVMSFTETSGSPSNNAILYLNGSNVLTTTIKYSNDTVNVEIGRGGSAGGQGQLFTGNINLIQIYNRALTAAEVLQNYRAVKGRFGL